jgi:hypothetical protein
MTEAEGQATLMLIEASIPELREQPFWSSHLLMAQPLNAINLVKPVLEGIKLNKLWQKYNKYLEMYHLLT